MTSACCRACGAPLSRSFADLGLTPLANSLVATDRANEPESFRPLHAVVCERCLLVQLDHVAPAHEIFSDYAYFSSWSTSWLAHAEKFAARFTHELQLDSGSLVVELASNDGYLLQFFRDRGVPVLGVEPAANVAATAEQRGVPTLVAFFGQTLGAELVSERGSADLVIANNVLAHVPDLHDFVAGIAALVAPTGRVTIEFPHLLRLIESGQFDTIYHEHFSYFSLLALDPVLTHHGLTIIDVDELSTHGGSLRIHAAHTGADESVHPRVEAVRAAERHAGLDTLETYDRFAASLPGRKRNILRALFDLKDRGLNIAGYGAPAKANTLLNWCGIGPDLLDFTVDANPVKQDRLLPGTRVPVLHPDALTTQRPDVVWLLPWNLRSELERQLAPLRESGTRFFVTHPEPELF